MFGKSFKNMSVKLTFLALSVSISAQEYRVVLEEPINGATATGISNLRGWAISDSGVAKLELYVNGQFVSEVPYGGERRDVQAAFPGVPGSLLSGFGQTYNYGELGAGNHTITIRLTTNDGRLLESSSNFSVVAFPDPFMTADESPDISSAVLSLDSQSQLIQVQNVAQGDDQYTLELKWEVASQSFKIQRISSEADNDSGQTCSSLPGGCAEPQSTVYVVNKTWAQPADFVGVSRSELLETCGGSTCTGPVAGYDLTGWVWADGAALAELFNHYQPSPALGYSPSENIVWFSRDWYEPAADQWRIFWQTTPYEHLSVPESLNALRYTTSGLVKPGGAVDSPGVAYNEIIFIDGQYFTGSVSVGLPFQSPNEDHGAWFYRL